VNSRKEILIVIITSDVTLSLMSERVPKQVRRRYRRKPGAFDRFTCAQANEQGERIMNQDPIRAVDTRNQCNNEKEFRL